jgi:hypothetical protein
MWSWFTFYLIIHILAVILASGPNFAFPFMGAMLEKHPKAALYMAEVTDVIERRLILPLAVVVPLAGTGLIYTAHVDLWHSEWMLISIVLYAAAFCFALFVQLRNGTRMVKLLKPLPPGPPPEGATGPPPDRRVGEAAPDRGDVPRREHHRDHHPHDLAAGRRLQLSGGFVSRIVASSAAATRQGTALTANAAAKPNASAVAPATSGPRTNPRSPTKR